MTQASINNTAMKNMCPSCNIVAPRAMRLSGTLASRTIPSYTLRIPVLQYSGMRHARPIPRAANALEQVGNACSRAFCYGG